MAPRRLASPLHSLPPILDNVPQTPTSSCSKGARGLSVQPRVLGIFTETTVSPDPSLRQRPSRYAIRAGRNFASILRFRRRRLSLHPGWQARGRRLIELHRFALASSGPDLTSSSDDQSLRGQAPKSRLPTGLPFRVTTSLKRRIRGGLPRYSRFVHRDYSRFGQFVYPTRNFAGGLSYLRSRSSTSLDAQPCMSPCRRDHLIIQCLGCLAYGL